MDRHEALRKRIHDDLDSESPPKPICGGCLERNGRSGGVLEASWRRLRPPSGPLGPFRGGLLAPSWTVMRPRENEFKTNFIRIPLRSHFMEDVSSETAVLVEYWRLLGAILGPFRGLLGPFGGFLGSSWTVQSPPRAKPRRS